MTARGLASGLRRWLKRWVLWHMPCPIHGVDHTWKSLDPDASWDAGMITRCSACGNRWTGEIEAPCRGALGLWDVPAEIEAQLK